MTKTIQIVIDPKSKITMTTEGYTGTECQEASKMFERLGRVVLDTSTEEMYRTNQIQGIVLENGGFHG